MPYKPVDTQIKVIVGPLWSATDYKSELTTVAYNAAGMNVAAILEKDDGTIVATDITLSNSGDYLWTHVKHGYYSIVLPASGEGSFNNTDKGTLRIVGSCDGALPFGSVAYDVGKAQIDVADFIAATGITEGGNWSIAKLGKIIAAFIAGQGQDSTVEGWKDVLDPDDGETVIFRVKLNTSTSPYREVVIEI